MFDAVRDDAKTCSAKCRVAFNRDKKAARAKEAARNARLVLMVKCAKCEYERDGMNYYNCPMCGCWDVKGSAAPPRSA